MQKIMLPEYIDE